MSQWHVPEDALRTWAGGAGGIAAAASVEQHLLACPHCQDAVAAMSRDADPGLLTLDLEASWGAIREQVEPQPMNVLGRALRRLGMRETDALVLSTAPALTAAWVTGVVLVAAFALLAPGWSPGRGLAVFLVLAPLLPVAGVATAYGYETDPTHELTLAAPYSKIRLLLLRTGIVVATCVPITLVAAIPLEGPWWVSVVWLLPAAAFVLATLAAATYVPPAYAAGAVVMIWIGVTGPAVIRREPEVLLDATALVSYVVIAVVAGIVFTTRFRHLATDWRIG
jgi:hypothetical protein